MMYLLLPLLSSLPHNRECGAVGTPTHPAAKTDVVSRGAPPQDIRRLTYSTHSAV
jgi:hypothetical protein